MKLEPVARRWFVAYGPDSRHLQDARLFALKRDAVVFYESRQERAKQLFSLDFEPWQCGKNRRVLREDQH